MYFNLRNRNNDLNEMIKFLNSNAKEFYSGKHSFEFRQYGSFFKSNLLSALIELERVIKGTFGCDIFMKYANINDLKVMFPNATKTIFKLESSDDLKIMGRVLEILRNMNAHAFLSKQDFAFLLLISQFWKVKKDLMAMLNILITESQLQALSLLY